MLERRQHANAEPVLDVGARVTAGFLHNHEAVWTGEVARVRYVTSRRDIQSRIAGHQKTHRMIGKGEPRLPPVLAEVKYLDCTSG